MRKLFKKTVCVLAAAVMGTSLFASSACSGVYRSKKLSGDISGEVTSNGGFVVEKGDFIYYINGKQTNSADNTYGNVETGALMRISKSNLAARNYSSVETVVPEIVHSGNTDAGIFIYGDYVYYSTPSTEKNSDGQIQYSNIVFKRAKLDGTEVMKGYFAKYTNNSIQYRFVVANDVVYLLYVATGETLYSSSYTNLHSVNTVTGEDTLLAYNVGSVIFDRVDFSNPRVYYTMNATDYTTTTSPNTSYNQIYTVTADVTEPKKEYDLSFIEDYDAEKDPLYVNYGELVLDGIGWIGSNIEYTIFNAEELSPEVKDEELLALRESSMHSDYTYTLSNYQNGTLFYTRKGDDASSKLFAVKEHGEGGILETGHMPSLGNPQNHLLIDGSGASKFTYMFEDNALTGAFIADGNGLIKAKVEDGKLLTEVDNDKTFYLTTTGEPTILFTQDNYVYYSESGSGANGYTVNRLDYSGVYSDYNKMPEKEDVNEFTPVGILDLDCTSDWYKPELIEGQIFFSSETKTMTEYSSGTANYSHVMVCDLNGADGIMTNVEIDALNERYDDIINKIEEVDENKNANLKNAYLYAFYTGEGDYIDEIIAAYKEADVDEEEYWSDDTVAKFKDFVKVEGDWEEFSDFNAVNGKKVYANRRDYFYSLLGKMTDENAEEYETYVRETYLRAMPENEASWFEGLSTGAKAGFLIGVIGGGLIVIAAGVVVALIVIRKRKEKLPTYKKRIKVDTTDDKSVDVYATEESEGKSESNE